MISRGQAKLLLLSLCLSVWLVMLGFVPAELMAQSGQKNNKWPKPESLLQQLDDLGELSQPIQTWSTTTKQIVISLTEASPTFEQRAFSIEQLIKQRDELAQINAEVWQSVKSTSNSDIPSTVARNTALQVSSEIVRMHYRLSRRIEIWQSALAIPVGDSLGDMDSPFRQVGQRQLNFDRLEPSWVDYLHLEEFRATFETPSASSEEKRETARKILARIYSPALTANQSEFAKRVFDQDVVAFLKRSGE